MRRADRLFDIIQALRTASHPVTAAALAEQLEVTARTIYRDIAALQGSRLPNRGRTRSWICSTARFRSAALDVHE